MVVSPPGCWEAGKRSGGDGTERTGRRSQCRARSCSARAARCGRACPGFRRGLRGQSYEGGPRTGDRRQRTARRPKTDDRRPFIRRRTEERRPKILVSQNLKGLFPGLNILGNTFLDETFTFPDCKIFDFLALPEIVWVTEPTCAMLRPSKGGSDLFPLDISVITSYLTK
jgi:hypothetical protein